MKSNAPLLVVVLCSLAASSGRAADSPPASPEPSLKPLPVTPPPGKNSVPPENLKKGTMPSDGPAEAMARRILEAIVADRPDDVQDAFFPADPFDALKAIARPREYHDQLVKWYTADIHREHARIKNLGPLTFDGFKVGSCKWKAVGTEANKIAYWSCYRNHFYAKGPKDRVTFDLRAMINWGTAWYVTHLGPIPQQ